MPYLRRLVKDDTLHKGTTSGAGIPSPHNVKMKPYQLPPGVVTPPPHNVKIICTLDSRHTRTTTRVLVNAIKRMKKHPFCGAQLSINVWNFLKNISQLYPAPFQKCSGMVLFSYVNYCMSNVHHRFVVFTLGLVPTQQNYLSLCRDLIF